MGVDHQIIRLVCDHCVDHVKILLLQAGRILIAPAETLTHALVAQASPSAVIELHVTAAGGIQVGNDLTVCGHDIRGQLVVIFVELVVRVGVLVAGKHETGLRWGRHGLASNGIVIFKLLDELEMLHERMIVSVELAGHRGSVGGSDLVMEGNAMGGCDMVHAVEAPHEIEMPPAATEFTIGDDMQTGGLLLGNQISDQPVFDGFQSSGINNTCSIICTSLLEFVRTQIRTDHIGAERRILGICHDSPSTIDLQLTITTTKPTICYPTTHERGTFHPPG